MPVRRSDRSGPPDRTEKPDPHAPRVTVDRVCRRRVVVSTDAVARDAGIGPGDLLVHARARIPTLIAYQADPARDLAALGRIARWMHRYTLLVTIDPPDGVWLDITGCERLHGGERTVLSDLTAQLDHAGFSVRAAVADTPGCAHAIARHGPDSLRVVESGAAAMLRALTDLPVEALRLPAELRDSARRIGLDTIGDAVMQSGPDRVGRGPLAHRIGAGLFTQLDQVFGRIFEPLTPEKFGECVTAGLSFAEPLSTPEGFQAAIGVLVERVCENLERNGEGALRVDLVFEAMDQSSQAIRVDTSHPTRVRGHLIRMLVDGLERIDAERGIEAIRLVVSASATLAHTQLGIGSDEPRAIMTELIDRLAARSIPVWRASIDPHRPPETCVVAAAPAFGPSSIGSSSIGPSSIGPSSIGSSSIGSSRSVVSIARPSRLLDPPQPIAVMALLPNYPPVQFIWRRRRHRIRRADGPERFYRRRPPAVADTDPRGSPRDAESGWLVRDYFAVEDEAGQRFWLMREGDGVNLDAGNLSWYLQGLF